MWFNSTLFDFLNSMNVDHIHPLSEPSSSLHPYWVYQNISTQTHTQRHDWTEVQSTHYLSFQRCSHNSYQSIGKVTLAIYTLLIKSFSHCRFIQVWWPDLSSCPHGQSNLEEHPPRCVLAPHCNLTCHLKLEIKTAVSIVFAKVLSQIRTN